MKPTTIPIWGVQAGKTGDAASLVLSKNCVALGRHSMGDLSKLAPNLSKSMAEVTFCPEIDGRASQILLQSL